jgi:hypothetical protein
MRQIIKFMQKMLPKDVPTPMGRWNIDYCNQKMNTKVDLSNEDHCGPCGQYAITKIVPTLPNKNGSVIIPPTVDSVNKSL